MKKRSFILVEIYSGMTSYFNIIGEVNFNR